MEELAVTEVRAERFRAIVVGHEREQAEDTSDAITLAMIYFPGALVPAKSYIPVARSLQKILRSASVTLHVVIAAGHRGVGDLLRAGFTPLRYSRQQFNVCLAALRDQTSFSPTAGQLFIAGHSMGGMHACISAMHCQLPTSTISPAADPTAATQPVSMCAGVILHGSYATREYLSTPHFPPVATVLGDRDGLVHLSHIATHHRDNMQPLHPDISAQSTRTPIVILPGVSHTSFAAGATTGYVRARDLKPAIPPDAAIASIAAATAAFVLTTTCAARPHALPVSAPSLRQEAAGLETRATQIRARAAQSAAEFFSYHLKHDLAHYLHPYTDGLQQDSDGTTCMDAQRTLLATCWAAGSSHAHKPSSRSEQPMCSMEAPRLMHEQPGRVRAPPALRRDALASANATATVRGETRRSGGLGAGSAHSTAVVVRPSVGLTLRRRPGFRMSVPAAPTRMRCKFVTPAATHAAALCPSAAAAQRAPPPAIAIGAFASTSSAEQGAGSSLQACRQISNSAAVQLDSQDTMSAVNAACAAHSMDVAGGDRMRFDARAQAEAAGDTHACVGAYAAARMNEAIVNRVLQKLPNHVRELYRHSPRRLVFGADIVSRSRRQWLHASLSFESMHGHQAEGAAAARAVLRSSPSAHHGGSNGGDCGAARDVERPGEEVVCWDGKIGGHVVLRSPRFVDAEGVLCCTLVSEAQAFEYVLYGSQRGAVSAVAEGVEVDLLAPTVQPDIWTMPPMQVDSPVLA